MFVLMMLIVLVTLSNIAIAESLRLKNGARFRWIRSAGSGTGANSTRSFTSASSTAPVSPTFTLAGISSVITSAHSSLPSTTFVLTGSSSKPQFGSSAASDGAPGTSIVLKFPNGSPAATIFVTTSQLSTTLSATPISKSTNTQLTTISSTNQTKTTVLSTGTSSAPGQLVGDRSISKSSATSQPLLSPPSINQPTATFPGTNTTQTTTAGTSQKSPPGNGSGTATNKETSKVQVSFTIPGTGPTALPIPTPQSNLEIARALNVLFRTLTSNSTCNPTQPIEAAACINKELAVCGSSGTYSLSRCPQGKQCYALPKTGSGTGVEIGCDTTEHAQLILAANATSSESAAISTSRGTASVATRNITSPTTVTTASLGLPGGLAPLGSSVPNSILPPFSQPASSTNSAPQFPVPTTTITFLPGSISAPGLLTQPPVDGVTSTVTAFVTITGNPPTHTTSIVRSSRAGQFTTQLSTDDVASTVTKFITVTGSPPVPSASLAKSGRTDQPATQLSTDELTSTVTKFVTVTGSPPALSTTVPKSSKPSTSGGISSLMVPQNIPTVTKTVTSTVTVTETVTATATVRRRWWDGRGRL